MPGKVQSFEGETGPSQRSLIDPGNSLPSPQGARHRQPVTERLQAVMEHLLELIAGHTEQDFRKVMRDDRFYRSLPALMRRTTLPVIVITLGALAGCPVTQINRLPASSPLPAATSIAAKGDFTHTPSGYLFPTHVDAFERVALLQYDTAGLDVSAGYNDPLPGCLVVLTIYVYPTPRMSFVGADPDVVRSQESQWLNGAFNQVKVEIGKHHPGAVLKSEDARTQDGVPGRKAVYSIGDAESELYVFVVRHEWFLEYRATYPSQCADQARQAIGAFHAAWSGPAPSSRP